MKTSKYLLSIILISAAMLFIGEMYNWHLSEFEVRYPSVTFYSQKGVSQENMIDDIIDAAEDNNIGVFVVERNIESYIYERIKIYGTSGMEEFIKDDAGIETKTYKSLFLGSIDVSLDSFEKIPDISKIETYRVIGDTDNIIKFKQTLVNKYAGSFPTEGYEPFDIEFYTIVVWTITFALIILCTLYQIILTKKEMVIRLISGENILAYIRKNIISEILYFGVIILILFIIWSRFMHITYNLTISIICISVFIVINSSCYLFLKKINYKSDISRSNKTKRFLNISYTYKTFTVFLTVLIVSSCAVLISDGIEYYQQKEFFVGHRDKSYVMLSVPTENFEIEHQLKQELYDELDEMDVCTLVELKGFNGIDDNYIYADKGAIKYLKNKLPELNDQILSNKAYIISPRDYSKTGNDMDDSEGLLYSYSGTEDIVYEKIEYEGNLKVIAQNGEDGVISKFKRNPVIILNNMDHRSIDDYVWQGMMLNVEGNWDRFVSEHNLAREIVYKTNVYDNYIHNWQSFKRGILLGIILVTIMLFIEALIIKETLQFEYKINAVEFTLKKIMGYGILQRYGRLLKTTLLSGLISTMVAVTITVFGNTKEVKFIILAGTFAIVIEMLLIIHYIRKIERLRMQRILKGDAI